MLARALALAALAPLLLVPSARAASFSDVIPLYDADDGIAAVRDGEAIQLRFAPEAAPIYRRFAGRWARIGCASVTPVEQSGGMATSKWFGTEARVPRRRTTLQTGASGDEYDFCTLSVRRTRRDSRCPPVSASEEGQCVKLVVARTLRGRLHLARMLRVYDLGLAFLALSVSGDDGRWPELAGLPARFRSLFAGLPSADASPPPGRVGYWTDGRQATVSVLDLAGRRLYFSVSGTESEPQVRTNVPELAGPELPDIT